MPSYVCLALRACLAERQERAWSIKKNSKEHRMAGARSPKWSKRGEAGWFRQDRRPSLGVQA